MKLLHGGFFLFLARSCQGETINTSGIIQYPVNSVRLLETAGPSNEAEDPTTETDACYELLTGGDAETGEISDWEVRVSGEIEFVPDGPYGSSRSYKMSNRGSVNSGPGQPIDSDCLEEGKQYQVTAQIKITDENGGSITCNKYAEWLDPDFCPLFTISITTSNGVSNLNLGNDMGSHVLWEPGIWNSYSAVFTVDHRLAISDNAYATFRGSRPGVIVYFDDLSLSEYVGSDTRYNFWTGAPIPDPTQDPAPTAAPVSAPTAAPVSAPTAAPSMASEDKEPLDECDAITTLESYNTSVLLYSNYNYIHSGVYDHDEQCIVQNGRAESGYIDGWVSMGAKGGHVIMHNIGPLNSTKAFKHVDRPHRNSGPGQENIDMSCLQLNERYEIKAKIKLVDENGFPHMCNDTCGNSCPIFTFVHLSDESGIEQNLHIPNTINTAWEATEFNEYYSIFEVTQTFLDSVSAGFLFMGPRAGVSIIYTDVSLTKYTGSSETTPILETEMIDGPCSSLVTSGNAETGNINDWEIKDVISGELVMSSEAPPGSTKSYQHKSRAHVSSGPGQDINTTCLVEGKQYILTANIKIWDEIYGEYACDKYGVWLDPDFCPLFTIWIDEGEGNVARFNIGNDYPMHRVWQEVDWNPYYAIFTVDARLAATDTAYLYLRGPRPNATMYFTDVILEEYVGTDTRFNFWTSLGPGNSGEVSYDLPPWNDPEPDYPSVPDVFEYIYYHSTYALVEASTGHCTQLVKNGDAESGDTDYWEILGSSGAGSIIIHTPGPMDQTMSFKHIGRSHFNSGPGQAFDVTCLQLGAIYEVKAKIKLYDENGFPFRCKGNFVNDEYSCPLFTIAAKQPTGNYKYISKWNDIRNVPWYPDWFNEFHVLFQVDMDLVGAVEAKWYFRGPRSGINIAIDDVSIKLYDADAIAPTVTVPKPPGCQALMYNGIAEVGSISGWRSHDGNGYLSLDADGPEGDDMAFKFLARSHATNGPGQVIDISCLERGRTYKVNAKFFLEDGRGDPLECHPTAGWNTPLFCPMFSVHVFQPWGGVRWNFFNQLSTPQVAGWNDFETTFTIGRETSYPDKAFAYFRGPAKDIIIYFDEVTALMSEDAPEEDTLSIPVRDPNFECTGYCCEMVSNGDGEDIGGWIPLPSKAGSIVVHEGGADGSDYAIKLDERNSINSGPGQSIDTGCFVLNEFYEIRAKILLLDENENPVSCDKTADWNDAAFCPLLSIWYSTGDLMRDNSWFDIPNTVQTAWVSGQYNEYTAIFQMTEELLQAIEASFMFRGSSKSTQVIVDSVSFSPYMHNPDFVPADYDENPGFGFDFTSSQFQIGPYNPSTCDIPIVNGDFETGDTTGWFVNHGGELGILRCEANGGVFCLKHTQRTSLYMGPKQILGLDCLEEGRHFDVFAKIKLMDEDWNPVGCDKLAGAYSHCPIFTIHYVTVSGEEKWMYVANREVSHWDMNEFNDFYGAFVVSDELASATAAYFYFEKPASLTTIILDNVEIKELITEADTIYKSMTNTCNKFVLNGNAESAELRGWTPRRGGELVHYQEGADLTLHSIKHTGRKSFAMGPQHDLAVECLTGGMKYNFEAKIKLIDDETNEAFACDKTRQWIDDLACPLLTFQIMLPDGSEKWLYYNDMTKGKWQADRWNFFQATFFINEELADAESGTFYIERVRAGASIVIDEVVISRDCSVLITNWDAEIESLLPWYEHGGGEISLINGGANGSPKAFAHTGRLYSYSGPSHMLDVHCLTLGSKYVYSAEFKLIDSADGNKPFLCDKDAAYESVDGCPFFTLVLFLPGVDDPKYIHYKNTDSSQWVADEFNYFETEFEVNQEIYEATSAKMIFNGPRAGISILYDETKLDFKVDGDCENLIPNGHFETNEELVGWGVEGTGNLDIYEEGANGSSNSLICSGRETSNDGPTSDISHMCMFEGLVYEFTAYLKLLDGDGNPFECNKSAAYGTALACPTLGIEMNTPTEFVMFHPENSVVEPWVGEAWNEYKTIFVVSNELANAEWSHFIFKGVAPGVSIVIDDMSTEMYQADTVNCEQLVIKTNAEDGFTSGWVTNHGGYIETVEGGDNSTRAFAHFARGSLNSGPKQHLETLCLRAGQKYDLNARIKFVDSFNNPVGCDKAAPWKDPEYCVLFTFEMKLENGMKRKHYGNHYGGAWVTDEFNSFSSVVEIDEEMVGADSIFFYIQGPSPDKVIVFDNISLKLRE